MKMMSFGNPHVISAGLVVTLLTGLSSLSITDVSLPASPITYKQELGREAGCQWRHRLNQTPALGRWRQQRGPVRHEVSGSTRDVWDFRSGSPTWRWGWPSRWATVVPIPLCATTRWCAQCPPTPRRFGFRFYGFLDKAARECVVFLC